MIKCNIRDITERKKAEEKLRASEERYRSYIELTEQLAWITNTDGEVVEDIPVWRKFTGQSEEETKGAGWAKALHPDDVRHTMEAWNKAVATKSAYEVEYRIRRYDGVYRDFWVHGVPVVKEDGSIREWVGTCIDITERKRAEETLHKERDFIAAVLDTAGALVVVLDKEGRITRFNRACEAITGYSASEVLGRVFWEFLVPPEELRGVLHTWEALRSGDFPNKHENRWMAKDGSTRLIAWSNTAIIRPGGEIEHIIGTGVDITERKRADEEIRKLNDQLIRKGLELELANKELDSFTSAVSHDLKNELIVISAFTRRLFKRHKEKPDAKGQEYMAMINSSMENMIALVEDLLELSRVSEVQMKVEPLDLSELAWSVLKKYQGKDTKRQVEVVVPKKIQAQGDRRLLSVVLNNLLNNAWKFTKNSDPARIELGVTQESEQLIFFVRDNGCGFSVPVDPEQIFLPFTRFHKVEDYPGTGVGLATVKRIISRHGGKIWVESSVGKGTVFYFTLHKTME